MTKAGIKLKEKRLEKGLTLEDVSKSTKIKVEFLEFIENGSYEKLPSVSYAQGFVRNYAKFLGLNEKEIMAIFRREFEGEKIYRVLPKGFEREDEFPIKRFKMRRSALFIIFGILIFLGYILFQYRYAVINPPLTIVSPKDLSQTSSSQITIFGKTDPNATVYVDSNAVSVDGSGNFQKVINVFPGKVTITVKAINKFLKETVKKLEVNVVSGT